MGQDTENFLRPEAEDTSISKWDLRGLMAAAFYSTWSKDPGTRVGAVIMDRNRHLVGWGYNGPPAGIADTEERLYNRDLKLMITLHAEHNAILHSIADIEGCVLYVWPFQPCAHCAAQIIQKRIGRVVTARTDTSFHWEESFRVAREMFTEARIPLTLVSPSHVMRGLKEALQSVYVHDC